MINNSVNLFIGYGLATVLYGGYTIHLMLKRKALSAALVEHTDSQDA